MLNSYYYIPPDQLRAGSVFSHLCDIAVLLPEFAHHVCVDADISVDFHEDLDQVAIASGLDIIYSPRCFNGPVFEVAACKGFITYKHKQGEVTIPNYPDLKRFQSEYPVAQPSTKVFGLLAGKTSYDRTFTEVIAEKLLTAFPECSTRISRHGALTKALAPYKGRIQAVPVAPGITRQLLTGLSAVFFNEDKPSFRLAREVACLKIPNVSISAECNIKQVAEKLLYNVEFKKALMDDQYTDVTVHDLRYNIQSVRNMILECIY